MRCSRSGSSHGDVPVVLDLRGHALFYRRWLTQVSPATVFVNAKPVTALPHEKARQRNRALMQRAKTLTRSPQKAAASILREGITTTEVEDFIDRAPQEERWLHVLHRVLRPSQRLSGMA